MITVYNKGMCVFETPSAGSLLPVRMIMRKTSMTVLNDIGIACGPNKGGQQERETSDACQYDECE